MTTPKEMVPHPLKGIVNTNDDPMACAICCTRFGSRFDNSTVTACCGKAICDGACELRMDEADACIMCKARFAAPGHYRYLSNMGKLKKHAKKGEPWAQFHLASAFRFGHGVAKSEAEALRWYEKAVKRNHPDAAYSLGIVYFYELRLRSRADLAKSAACFVKCLRFRTHVNSSCSGLTDVANGLRKFGTDDAIGEAKSILLLLSGENFDDSPRAQIILGQVYNDERNRPAAYDCLVSASLNAKGKDLCQAALGALEITQSAGDHAQGRFWAMRVKLSEIDFTHVEARRRAVISVIGYQRFLRQLRDTCGGCGAEFEGKERNFCRGCRTYCYCSRDCQKMHWNRKVNGHREDCKGLTEIKQKMKEASRRTGTLSS